MEALRKGEFPLLMKTSREQDVLGGGGPLTAESVTAQLVCFPPLLML